MTPGFSKEYTGLPTDEAAAGERESRELKEQTKLVDTQQDGAAEESEASDSAEPDSEGLEEGEADADTGQEDGTEPISGTESGDGDIAGEGGRPQTGQKGTDGTGMGGTEEKTGRSRIGRLLLRWFLFLLAGAGPVRLVKTRIHIYHAYIDYEIQRKHYRKAIRCVNRRLSRKLAHRKGLRRLRVSDREYEQLLGRTFPRITPDDWSRYMEIVKKAAYSAEELSQEEANRCREIYESC